MDKDATPARLVHTLGSLTLPYVRMLNEENSTQRCTLVHLATPTAVLFHATKMYRRVRNSMYILMTGRGERRGSHGNVEVKKNGCTCNSGTAYR